MIHELIQEALDAGACLCPCCGSQPMMIHLMMGIPRPGREDLSRSGTGIACSNDDCRLSTQVTFREGTLEERVAMVLTRWNRRQRSES